MLRIKKKKKIYKTTQKVIKKFKKNKYIKVNKILINKREIIKLIKF